VDGAQTDGKPLIRYEGAVEDIGPAARVWLSRAGQRVAERRESAGTHADAIQSVLSLLEDARSAEGPEWHIDAVGHRVVHGGMTLHLREELPLLMARTFIALSRLHRFCATEWPQSHSSQGSHERQSSIGKRATVKTGPAQE
jgi:acetate kinase